uniref:Uncharacterized protein n=1 Tax=Chlorocebus sabaeus TaxID=60711 RepID=A0A0D9RZ65_CHLSB
MRSGAYCMRVSRSCSSHSTDIWKSASSDSTGGGSESSRARISSKLSSSTSSTSNSSGSSDGKVAAEAEAPRGLVSMPGRMKGKAREWGARGALKAQRRRTAKVSGLSRKGPSARIPPAHPPVRPPGRPPPPPPPPGSEGSRRTCPFHCGSLCPAWRRSWIAGFLSIPDWAPFDSLYHPVPGWRLRC